jgi:hypothetical protein
MPKRVEVVFNYSQHGRIDKTLNLNKVQQEAIRIFFANTWAASKTRMFLQYNESGRTRIEVFDSHPATVKEAGVIISNILNSRRAIEDARQSLKLQGKPLR